MPTPTPLSISDYPIGIFKLFTINTGYDLLRPIGLSVVNKAETAYFLINDTSSLTHPENAALTIYIMNESEL
jgi:hypothetical protein